MITARTVQISSSLVCSMACFWHTASTTWLHHWCAADSLAHSFASDVGSDDLIGSQWPNRTIWDFSWDFCSGPWPLINSCLCPPSQCETQSVRQARSPLVGPAKEKMTPRHFPGTILGQKRHIAFEAATCMLACLLVIPKLCGNCHLQRWQKEESESSQNRLTRTFHCLQVCKHTHSHTVSIREPCFSLLSRAHSCPRSLTFSPSDNASRKCLLLKS